MKIKQILATLFFAILFVNTFKLDDVSVWLFLMFFFPIGLYLIWKYNAWPKTFRWIGIGVFAFAVITNLYFLGAFEIPHSISTEVTFDEAEAFMQSRCEKTNQTLMKKKSVDFEGTKIYMFLSVAENGYVCISSISENALKLLGADCGPSNRKIQEWNAVN
jgi:hypothetical protein